MVRGLIKNRTLLSGKEPSLVVRGLLAGYEPDIFFLNPLQDFHYQIEFQQQNGQCSYK